MIELENTTAVERPRLTREEQEVIITTSAADDLAEVYAADPIYIRKMDKLVERDPENYKVKSKNSYSTTYTMPKKLLGFRVPSAPRVFTEEERAMMRERGKKLSELRNANRRIASEVELHD